MKKEPITEKKIDTHPSTNGYRRRFSFHGYIVFASIIAAIIVTT